MNLCKHLLSSSWPTAVDFSHRSFAQGAMKAYEVYGGPFYLSVAETIWNYVNNFAITPDQVRNGIPERNMASLASCGSESSSDSLKS